MKMQHHLETERLSLRPPQLSDLTFLCELNRDPVVMEFLPGLLSREDSERQLRGLLAHFEQLGFGIWLIELQGTNEPLGFAGLKKVDFDAAFVPAVEVAWRLARLHWGRGYATEAARAAVRFGFERLGLAELVGFTVPGNRRSIAVLERLGMLREPAFDFEHPRLAPAHPLRAHLFFRLTRPLAP
jgi:RimJ/RimL family protein N-acetyltransferase